MSVMLLVGSSPTTATLVDVKIGRPILCYGMSHQKYTRELLEPLVKESVSVAGVARKIGLKLAGGSHTHLSKVIKKLGIDTSHFTGQVHNRGKPGYGKKHWSEVLVLNENRDRREDAYRLRRALIESGREYKCAKCGLGDTWNGCEIRLHVDHKNGEWLDNHPENLDFLCPNCHSQTSTFGNNKGWVDLTSTNRYCRMRRQKTKSNKPG